MRKRAVLCGLVLAAVAGLSLNSRSVSAAPPGQPTNWDRFYHYPYVYYPQNFQTYPQSYDDLYHRYPIQKQIPVYNAGWHNFYLMERPYHSGYHYILDIF